VSCSTSALNCEMTPLTWESDDLFDITGKGLASTPPSPVSKRVQINLWTFIVHEYKFYLYSLRNRREKKYVRKCKCYLDSLWNRREKADNAVHPVSKARTNKFHIREQYSIHYICFIGISSRINETESG
jgi:hypothetical protein